MSPVYQSALPTLDKCLYLYLLGQSARIVSVQYLSNEEIINIRLSNETANKQ